MQTWRTLLAPIATFLLIATAVGAQIGSGQTRENEGDQARVKEVQKTLRQKGHDPGTVDGFMGPQTTAAVKTFQKEHGLTATGQLDASTLAKLGITSTASDRAPRADSDVARRPGPSQTQTGGDTQASPADPGQAHKSGGNVGEGASYSRSTEKPTPAQTPQLK